ncbi:MAG: hypothetical protein ACO3XK_14960, partial [bacterium]
MARVLELDWDKKILLFGIQKFIYFTGVTAKISWVRREIIDEFMEKSQPFIICAWHHDIYF